MATSSPLKLTQGRDNLWTVCFYNNMNLDEGEVKLAFSKYGDIGNIHSAGAVCFVRFYREADAQCAIDDTSIRSAIGDFVKPAKNTLKSESNGGSYNSMNGGSYGQRKIPSGVNGRPSFAPINIDRTDEKEDQSGAGAASHANQPGFGYSRGGSQSPREGQNQFRGRPRGSFNQQRGGYNQQRGGRFNQPTGGQYGPYRNCSVPESSNFSLRQGLLPTPHQPGASQGESSNASAEQKPKLNITMPFVKQKVEESATANGCTASSISSPSRLNAGFINKRTFLERCVRLKQASNGTGDTVDVKPHLAGPEQESSDTSTLSSALDQQLNIGEAQQHGLLNHRIQRKMLPVEDSLKALRDDDLETLYTEDEFADDYNGEAIGDVIIGNYPINTTEEDLWALFGENDVIDITVHYTHQNIPYCHVLVASEEKMEELLSYDGESLDHKQIIVGAAEEFCSIGFSKVFGERQQQRRLGALARTVRK